MKRSNLYKRMSYRFDIVTAPNFLSTRGFDVVERAFAAQAAVIERTKRAAAALESNKILYAIIGGNAVASWVASVDPGAMRSTPDVDVLLNRSDLERAIVALESVGFCYRQVENLHFLLDGPDGSPRSGIFLIFAGEKAWPEHSLPAPEMNEICYSDRGFYIASLESTVRMKLTSFRLKDQVHLQDLLSVGLIDETWLEKYPSDLALRLRDILENPEA